ncbi:hypothetical protein [Herbaspirillum huttiense]|uniref:Uncharacterized protein n=2 Tax=Herbaspirillum huttiense TaxID=863372 RepID=A0AAJ2HG49_9BURK|nr:hypothetical protein [Herbaspirillum huttiense]MDR9839380.1 hypothetical protein [Herbaspirillum huttiense]
MLYSIDKQEYLRDIPHQDSYVRWRSRLTEKEYLAIAAELNSKIEGDEVHTSSWIPGDDWRGTVYEPIYEKACLRDASESGKCFGLFLWVVLQERSDSWAFGRYEKDGVPIQGLTYFKVYP